MNKKVLLLSILFLAAVGTVFVFSDITLESSSFVSGTSANSSMNSHSLEDKPDLVNEMTAVDGTLNDSALSIKSDLGSPRSKDEIISQLFHLEQLDYSDDWCHVIELNQEGNDEAINASKIWNERRGYFPAGEPNNYLNYSEAALIKIGEQGDLRALSTLIARREVDEDIKLWASETAAIHGATSAIAAYHSMVKLASASYSFQSKDVSEHKQAKQELLEALAWSEFAAMRGDLAQFDSAAFTISDIKGLDFSDVEKNSISQRAREIYNDLNRKRVKLGLEPFDNTVPKSVQINQDLLIRAEYRERGWDAWGTQYLTNSKCVEKNVEYLSQLKSLAGSVN